MTEEHKKKLLEANQRRWEKYEPVYDTPEYRSYSGAKQRCTNPKAKRYQDYGGRGIEFRFTSFKEFITHVGLKPTPRHSLDRNNNDGHYEPGNVKWATPSEQNKNQRKRFVLSKVPDSELLREAIRRGLSLTN